MNKYSPIIMPVVANWYLLFQFIIVNKHIGLLCKYFYSVLQFGILLVIYLYKQAVLSIHRKRLISM